MRKLTNATRRAWVAAVAIGTLAGPAVVIPQFANADPGTVSATTALNVRAEPTISSRILGVLSAGEQVERRGEPQGEWTPVRYRGEDAWVFSAFASLGNSASAAGGTATATDPVNVRRGTSTLSRVIGVLATGEQVSVTGDAQGSWVPVSFQGEDGFVYAAYLSFDASTRVADVGDSGPVKATTSLNVRTGPSLGDQVIGVLATGEQVEVRGEPQGDWTPIRYQGRDAWAFSRYLTNGSGNSGDGSTSTGYTSDAVNLRTGPSIDYRIVRVLSPNTEVQLTGVTQDGFSQVLDEGQLRWISTQYVSDSPVTSAPDPGPVQGPVAPADGDAAGGTLNTGGSSGLDELRDTTKRVVYSIRQNYPQITTMYGVRADPYPDHPSGRAVDLMMPNGAADVALGDQVAAYLQQNADALNIEYLIWRQRIWINGDSGWTWMSDRGGTTANHYDHVHVTVRY